MKSCFLSKYNNGISALLFKKNLDSNRNLSQPDKMLGLEVYCTDILHWIVTITGEFFISLLRTGICLYLSFIFLIYRYSTLHLVGIQ